MVRARSLDWPTQAQPEPVLTQLEFYFLNMGTICVGPGLALA